MQRKQFEMHSLNCINHIAQCHRRVFPELCLLMDDFRFSRSSPLECNVTESNLKFNRTCSAGSFHGRSMVQLDVAVITQFDVACELWAWSEDLIRKTWGWLLEGQLVSLFSLSHAACLQQSLDFVQSINCNAATVNHAVKQKAHRDAEQFKRCNDERTAAAKEIHGSD